MAHEKLDKLLSLVKSRRFSTDEQVRAYLSTRIKDNPPLVEAIVAKLTADGVISTVPANTLKQEPGVHPYKRAMAQFFSTRRPMSRSKMKMEMSFGLGWFKIDDADTFIGFCIRDGHITETDGIITPTFDPKTVDIPAGWSFHEELNIRTGREIAQKEYEEHRKKTDMAFVQQENMAEARKVDDEDGIVAEEQKSTDDWDDITEDFVDSDREERKKNTVKKLVGLGIPAKTAKGMFDCHELNWGLLDLEMFMFACVQYEQFSDAGKIKEAFDLLVKE